MRILIVEDSEPLRRSLSHGLSRRGYAVDAVGDGETGQRYALSDAYDVIVLDLMLPKRDGLSVLKALREANCNTHVLILSARDQVDDRIQGLDLGADDYLVKPFAFVELCARIEAGVRRRYNDRNPQLRVNGLLIDTGAREVSHEGQRISLSPKEYSVLEALCRHRGTVLSRAQLIEKTSDFEQAVSDNAVDVLISALRKKLRSGGVDNLIHTKRGFGYFVG